MTDDETGVIILRRRVGESILICDTINSALMRVEMIAMTNQSVTLRFLDAHGYEEIQLLLDHTSKIERNGCQFMLTGIGKDGQGRGRSSSARIRVVAPKTTVIDREEVFYRRRLTITVWER